MSRLTKLSSIIVPTTLPNPNIYYDYFNRPDHYMVNGELTDSGHPWTIVNSAPKITNGVCGSDGYDGNQMATIDNTLTSFVVRYNAMLFGSSVGIMLRYKDKTHFYKVALSSQTLQLHLHSGNAITPTLKASESVSLDIGVKIAISVSGDTVLVYKVDTGGQTHILGATLTEFTGYNKIGLYTRTSAIGGFDNFEVGTS